MFIINPINIFGNVQNLLEDLKIGEYHSNGKYFTVVPGAFSDASRKRLASKKIPDGLNGKNSHDHY